MKKLTPELWLAESKATTKRHERELAALAKMQTAAAFPTTAELRPAKAIDIKVGRIVYYPENGKRDRFWKVVDEVLYPDDDFNAYSADDGCRYGLGGAYVKA